MKNALMAALVGFGAGLLAVYAAVYFEVGPVERTFPTEVSSVETSTVDAFRFTLEEEVKKKLGTPIEGYEPSMFIEVFPGLTRVDFDEVSGTAGNYDVQNGELIFVPDKSRLQHSAAGAINRQGYETLLSNVAARSQIDLSADGTLTDLMRVLTAE